MRLVPLVLSCLLVPAALAAASFEPREGTLGFSSCTMVWAKGTGPAMPPAPGCLDYESFPAGPKDGEYVVEFSWTPTREWLSLIVCISIQDGSETLSTLDIACEESTGGMTTLRIASEPRAEAVRISIQADHDDADPALFGAWTSVHQSVDYILFHEP